MTTYRFGKPTPDGYLQVSIETPAKRDRYSFTANLYHSKRSMERGAEPHACGQLSDEIASAYPEIGQWHTKLHLCDREGVPMHAVANGWYHLSEGRHDDAAKALNIDPAILPHEFPIEDIIGKKEAFDLFCNDLKAIWSMYALTFEAFLKDNQDMLSTFEETS